MTGHQQRLDVGQSEEKKLTVDELTITQKGKLKAAFCTHRTADPYETGMSAWCSNEEVVRELQTDETRRYGDDAVPTGFEYCSKCKRFEYYRDPEPGEVPNYYDALIYGKKVLVADEREALERILKIASPK